MRNNTSPTQQPTWNWGINDLFCFSDPRSTIINEPGKTPAFWGTMSRQSNSVTKDLLTSSLWFEKASLVLVVSGRAEQLPGSAVGGFSRQKPLLRGCSSPTLSAETCKKPNLETSWAKSSKAEFLLKDRPQLTPGKVETVGSKPKTCCSFPPRAGEAASVTNLEQRGFGQS